MRPLGIPYAYGEIINGRLYRVCPVCGEKLLEETDRTGEEVTTNYAEHFEAEHEGKIDHEHPSATVGVTETCDVVKEFREPNALKRAEEYVGSLPDAKDGRYYIDWPCYREMGTCRYCNSPITRSFEDGAWEDSSGACGCGDEEHEPLGDGPWDQCEECGALPTDFTYCDVCESRNVHTERQES